MIRRLTPFEGAHAPPRAVVERLRAGAMALSTSSAPVPSAISLLPTTIGD
jgi:hypothetical protein